MTDKLHSDFLAEVEQLLPADQLDDFVKACKLPLKKSITINPHKLSIDAFIELTTKRNRTLTPTKFIDQPTTFYIDREDLTVALGNTFLHQCGFFYIQEVAAATPAHLIDLQPGEVVLDIAAAPGGKTSQLANALLAQGGNPGLIVANDVNGARIPSLAHNLNRGGCYNTYITKFNGFSFGKNLTNFFDHVLVDAPCSGEGTGFKSDVAMKHWHKAEINKIVGTQFQILVSAIKSTKEGGTIIYSTCTINPYENEGVLAKVKNFFGEDIEIVPIHLNEANPGVALTEGEDLFDEGDKVARFWPHLQGTGGFFVSKIRKLKATEKEANKEHKLLPQNQFKVDHSKGLQNKVKKWLTDYFGIKIDPELHFFVATKAQIYLCSPDILKVMPHLHAEKFGIPVLKIDRDQYRPTHYLGNILGDTATKNVVELNEEQMQDYAQGKRQSVSDLSFEYEPKTFPYRILKRNGHGMSVTKVVGDEVKNKMFK